MSWSSLFSSKSEASPVPQIAPPQAELDDQSLYGNAFLGSLLGAKPQTLDNDLGNVAVRIGDQVKARQELADKFDTNDIMGGDGRAGVTEGEFDEIVEMYSDIRLGRTNLKLDTSNMDEAEAEAFRSGTMDDMAKMMQTESGRKLIRELAYNEDGKQTTVGRQFTGQDPRTGSALDKNMDCSESYARNSRENRTGDETGWCIHDREHDGKGVHLEVRYRPGESTKTPDGDIRSDVTLYHELAHAWHNQRGDQASGSHNGVENHEYQATGLGRWDTVVDEHGEVVPNENLYRSERGDFDEALPRRETYNGQTAA